MTERHPRFRAHFEPLVCWISTVEELGGGGTSFASWRHHFESPEEMVEPLPGERIAVRFRRSTADLTTGSRRGLPGGRGDRSRRSTPIACSVPGTPEAQRKHKPFSPRGRRRSDARIIPTPREQLTNRGGTERPSVDSVIPGCRPVRPLHGRPIRAHCGFIGYTLVRRRHVACLVTPHRVPGCRSQEARAEEAPTCSEGKMRGLWSSPAETASGFGRSLEPSAARISPSLRHPARVGTGAERNR